MDTESQYLAGKTFVFKGEFYIHSHPKTEEIVRAAGGRVVQKITSRTAFLVLGECWPSSYIDDANRYGVPIIHEEELGRILQQKWLFPISELNLDKRLMGRALNPDKSS